MKDLNTDLNTELERKMKLIYEAVRKTCVIYS